MVLGISFDNGPFRHRRKAALKNSIFRGTPCLACVQSRLPIIDRALRNPSTMQLSHIRRQFPRHKTLHLVNNFRATTTNNNYDVDMERPRSTDDFEAAKALLFLPNAPVGANYSAMPGLHPSEIRPRSDKTDGSRGTPSHGYSTFPSTTKTVYPSSNLSSSSTLANLNYHYTRKIVSAPSSPASVARVSSTKPTTVCSSDSSVGSAATSSSSSSKPYYQGPFYTGSCLLALPEDEEHLSPLHCFMRKHCVELFTRSAGDVVGIQCQHCKHRTSRAERAVCYPSALKNIYHSIETWQRRHSAACQDMPSWCKREMAALMRESRSGAGGRRSYWEESAKRLGMVDTELGIRFAHPPGTVLPVATPRSALPLRPSLPIVQPEDMDLNITGFLYMLMDQMETCYFSEQDRVGGRSKVKTCRLGYPGVQCKHCGGKAGFGRYFPLSKAALTSANSDRNIYNHIAKCRKCPDHIRDTLSQLQSDIGYSGSASAKNKRGTRKTFFERIWERMHQPE